MYYSCICSAGWQGLHCTRRNVDCLSSSSSELCGKGTCVHASNALGYSCICDQGYTTNGVLPACTVDVNECSSPIPHCSMDPEVQCINLPGSYTCGQCPHGMNFISFASNIFYSQLFFYSAKLNVIFQQHFFFYFEL